MDEQMRLCHRQDNTVAWVHRLEMSTTDVDLSDLDDEAFESYILAHLEVQ